MSYRTIKRLLGETSLERKCRLLFGGGLLLLECASDAVPALEPGWQLHKQKRYGGSTVLVLQPA